MLEQDNFLEKYKVKNAFENSGLAWTCLESIYEDYMSRENQYKAVCAQINEYISEGMRFSVESVKCRYKDAEHLIEKIIRKRGIEQNHKYAEIDSNNYTEIVRDLIGVRILVLAKEDWEQVFDWLTGKFNKNIDDAYMAEAPRAYTRYGDRDIFHDKICQEHTNKGYRSQHYIVWFRGNYCEIQVRTLAEELHGEFDHKVKYPYSDSNNFLKRYAGTMAQLTDSIDELISTCFQMGEDGWTQNNQYYKDDHFIDWKNISRNPPQTESEKSKENADKGSGNVDVLELANHRLLRKE